MRALTANEVRQAVRGRWLSRDQKIPVRAVSIDSRTSGPDDLFVAVRGDRFDGHDFLPAAAEAGCVAAVVDLAYQLPADLMTRFPAGVIGVENTRQALLDLAGFYRGVIPATIIAVTGSNGKTTVKRMIHHILSTRLTGTCSPKSYNNEIGVPLTLLGAGGGDDYVICEVGTNAPGEIARLTRVVRPNIAVITCVCEAHLENFGSLERIAAEKAAILGWLGEQDIGVVSADSEYLEHALMSYPTRIIRFGQSPGAQLRLTGYKGNGKTQRFQINERQWVDLPLGGRHSAINAIGAIAVSARFGFTQEDAAAALADFPGVPMRQEWVQAGGIRILNDAYNANPGSMRAALSSLTDCKARRRILIAGDMRELGEDAESIHEQIGREIGGQRVALVVGIGPLGGRIADGARHAGAETVAFKTVTAAARAVGELLRDGDVILLKGSRAMGLEKLLPALKKAGEALGASEQGGSSEAGGHPKSS